MLRPKEWFYAARTSCLLLRDSEVKISNRLPFRSYCKPVSSKEKDFIKSPEMKPQNRFNYANISKYFSELFEPDTTKEDLRYIVSETKRFFKEEFSKNKFKNIGNFEINDERRKVHILYKFENEEDLKGFEVLTDSTYMAGYSSASFKLTENETAIFSGNLCADLPKTGEFDMAGYANIHFPKQLRAFGRVKPHNWLHYTHLVFKIRGDGRTYLVILHLPNEFEETSYYQYALQLYTRGGPYWQIAKIPFSHFFLIRKGKISDIQNSHIPLHNIHNISITTGAYPGPFKLEIEYVGLEFKDFHNQASPYEQYR